MCSTSSAHEQGRCCVQDSRGRWSPLSSRQQVAHTDRSHNFDTRFEKATSLPQYADTSSSSPIATQAGSSPVGRSSLPDVPSPSEQAQQGAKADGSSIHCKSVPTSCSAWKLSTPYPPRAHNASHLQYISTAEYYYIYNYILPRTSTRTRARAPAPRCRPRRPRAPAGRRSRTSRGPSRSRTCSSSLDSASRCPRPTHYSQYCILCDYVS
jgi:hypothetical protein